MTRVAQSFATSNGAPIAARLGEELPIFCEKCGYSLHGSPQVRCERCAILQFQCPECGHHQPINTLRPAFTAWLGRTRAMSLAILVVAQLIFFAITLFAWCAMGANWSYSYDYDFRGQSVRVALQRLDPEMISAFTIYGACFGAVSRMLLIRWRRGTIIGLVLSVIVFLAVCFGAWMQYRSTRSRQFILPFSSDLMIANLFAMTAIIIASMLSWPLWVVMVHVFLPKRAGNALLDWQRSFSDHRNSRALVSLGGETVPSSPDSRASP